MTQDVSSLTVKALKQICQTHGVSVSGKKSEIVQRLLEIGLPRSLLGLEPIETGSLSEESETSQDDRESEEMEISIDDDIDEDSTVNDNIENPRTSEVEDLENTMVLDAEVIDAEIIEAEIFDTEEKNQTLTEKVSEPAITHWTLTDQLKNPKFSAVLITILLAGGGWYWYAASQIEPFTPDALRYGDQMEYTISNGGLDVSGEFVDIVVEQLNVDEEICRLRLAFSGTGSTSVTQGDANQIANEGLSDDLLGVVRAKGGLGLDWLAVEKKTTMEMSSLDIQRHSISSIPGSTACSDLSVGGQGRASLATTSWNEIGERDVLATQLDWTFELDDTYRQGQVTSYGVGGLLGAIESLLPGIAMVLNPIELNQLLGDDLIETGVSGEKLGWVWNVLGPDEIGGTQMFKISAYHEEVKDLCLGYANIIFWVDGDSPWAVQQEVDISIKGKDGNRDDCSTTSKLLGDLVLPEGSLDYQITLARSSTTRGEKLLDLGVSYNSRPNPAAWTPSSSELSNWGENEQHLPDDSSIRNHPLEVAMDCMPEMSEAVAARQALSPNGDGFVWRAIDTRTGDVTEWNISWVDEDEASGWIRMSISGGFDSYNCTYLSHGVHDNGVAWNRQSIPAALNMSMIESNIADASRYPMFTGNEGFFKSQNTLHPETRIGHLVVIPDSEYGDWLERLNSVENGATTVDFSRTWDEGGWTHQLSMALDATDGRVIGWNLYKQPVD